VKRFIAAIQFLTVCPFVGRVRCGERDLGRCAPFFPLVGIVLGAIVAAIGFGASAFFPALPASVLVVAALIGVSGGLHMDGLSDTADGFFSSRPRERVLEIMKDSHTGAMGVIAIVCCICTKIAMLASVPSALWLPAIFLMPVAGRSALVIHLAVLPYARAEGGLASVFLQNRLKGDAAGALAVMFLVAWYVASIPGVLAAAGSVLVTLVFSFWCKAKIGGFTGDTLGAVCELAELAPAIVAVAWGTAKAKGGI
jgi:adenosylcobinamide-GDP ribazoletransferase